MAENRVFSAIDTTGVTVVVEEVEVANEEATVVVLNSKGEEVAVVARPIEIGDTELIFDFVEEVDEKELTGVWTVNGAEYDFDALAAVAKVVEAGDNLVKLWNALQSPYFEGAIEDNIVAYQEAIAEDDVELNTVEDVNKLIADVNKANIDKEEEAAIVKKVADAENELQLLNALKDSGFERVNSDWILLYADEGNLLDVDEETATIKTIQESIDEVNFGKVMVAVQEAEMSIDSDKVKEARDLFEYVEDDKEDEIGPKIYGLDILRLEDAVISVVKANTNAKLKSALLTLDELDTELVEKYEDISKGDIIPGLTGPVFESDFDYEDYVIEANMGLYRQAIEAVEQDIHKNQRSDISIHILGVNNVQTYDLLEAITELDEEADADDLLKALKDAGIEGVVDANKDAYWEANDIKTAATHSISLSKYDLESVLTVRERLEEVAEAVAEAVKEVNDDVEEAKQYKALNDAKTAEEVHNALLALENEAYINVSSVDRLFVAETLLNRETPVEITAETIGTDLGTAIKARQDAIDGVNELLPTSDTTDVVEALEAIDSVYAKKGLVEKSAIAEDFFDGLVFNDDGDALKTPFKTIAAIKTAAGL